jgi:hypothetical protein
VARTGDHLPVGIADAQRLAIPDAGVGDREARDHLAEVGPARARAARDLRLVPPRAAPEGELLVGHLGPRVGGEHAHHQPFGARHQQVCVEPAAQPAGKPDMVGMHVRPQHPPDPPARKRPVQDRPPCFCGARARRAGINGKKIVAIVQDQPVDVFQRPRHRHPPPPYARRDRQQLARLRATLAEGEGEPGVAGRHQPLVPDQRALQVGHGTKRSSAPPLRSRAKLKRTA